MRLISKINKILILVLPKMNLLRMKPLAMAQRKWWSKTRQPRLTKVMQPMMIKKRKRRKMMRKRRRRMMIIRNMIKQNPFLMVYKLRQKNLNQNRICKLKKMLILRPLVLLQQLINHDILIDKIKEEVIRIMDKIGDIIKINIKTDRDRISNIIDHIIKDNNNNKIVIPPING